jgi:hypothetical protein
VSIGSGSCPICKTGTVDGNYCRRCGVPLESWPEEPTGRLPGSRASAPPATRASGSGPAKLDGTRSTRSSPSTSSTGSTRQREASPAASHSPRRAPTQMPPGPGVTRARTPRGATPPAPAHMPAPWIAPQSQPPPDRGSTALAVVFGVCLVLLAIAIVTAVIVLSANSGSTHARILTQSNPSAPSAKAP